MPSHNRISTIFHHPLFIRIELRWSEKRQIVSVMDFQITDLFFDYTLRIVGLGAAMLGLVSGALGTFAVLRRQSLLGDAISHAALLGITLAFLLTGSRAPLALLLGASIAGWLGMLTVMSIVRTTRVKEDSALGLVLSVFFGAGLVVLTFIQKLPDASQAGLDKFLFGQAATLLASDVKVIAVLGFIALAIAFLFWKEFKLLSFDASFGASLGFSTRGTDLLLTSVIVIAIVIGLQTVGVVLMSAMLVAPAAAARQWTDSLSKMFLLAGAFGATAGVSGALASSTTARLPTGPMIVLCLSVIVIISLLLAPRRGLVWQRVRDFRNRRRLITESVLGDLYALSQQHTEADHAHSSRILESLHRRDGDVRRSLEHLAEQGLAKRTGTDKWILTEQGREAAQWRNTRGFGVDTQPQEMKTRS